MFKTIRSVVRLRKFEVNGTKRRLAKVGSVDDLRLLAKRRLPGGVFDYFDGAAEDEVTKAENSSAFSKIELRPRVLVDVSKIDTTTTIMGQSVPFPIALSPTGFTRIAHPQGELAVARVAGAVNLPYTLSTLGTRSIEEVARVATGPLWYQLYVWKDRGLSRELVERARDNGYKAIMLTVDTPVFGRRERDVRRGFTLPPKIGLETFVDMGLRAQRADHLLRGGGTQIGRWIDGGDALGLRELTVRSHTVVERSRMDPRGIWIATHVEGNPVGRGRQTSSRTRRRCDRVIESRRTSVRRCTCAGGVAATRGRRGGQLDRSPRRRRCPSGE